MRLNPKILTQFKSLTPRLRQPFLVMLVVLGVLLLAGLAYRLSRSTSDEIVVRLTPTPMPELNPTPQAVAAAVTPAVNDAAQTGLPDTAAPAFPPNTFYLSLAKDSAQPMGSVDEAQDEDILSYDGVDFAIVFDGSAAGLAANANIDAFDFVDPDTILISFDKPVSIGQLKVADSDIVKFEATSLGLDNTVGTFSLFFEGATVGLRTNRANVDALTLLPDGSLLISTEARVKVAGVNRSIRAEAEDILAFVPAAPGDYSSGAWSLYFEGSNAGIRSGSEDIDGLAIGPDGELYLSTSGHFSVKGLSGRGEDIFIATPASPDNNLAYDFSPTLFFEGSPHGLKRNNIDAISVP